MIQFRVVRFENEEQATKLVTELMPLAKKHWPKACGKFGDPFKINFELLGTAWQMKYIMLITARENGVLIGYALWETAPPFLGTKNWSDSLAFFMEKGFDEMLDFSAAVLKENGYQNIRITSNNRNKGMVKLLSKKGFNVHCETMERLI